MNVLTAFAMKAEFESLNVTLEDENFSVSLNPLYFNVESSFASYGNIAEEGLYSFLIDKRKVIDDLSFAVTRSRGVQRGVLLSFSFLDFLVSPETVAVAAKSPYFDLAFVYSDGKNEKEALIYSWKDSIRENVFTLLAMGKYREYVSALFALSVNEDLPLSTFFSLSLSYEPFAVSAFHGRLYSSADGFESGIRADIESEAFSFSYSIALDEKSAYTSLFRRYESEYELSINFREYSFAVKRSMGFSRKAESIKKWEISMDAPSFSVAVNESFKVGAEINHDFLTYGIDSGGFYISIKYKDMDIRYKEGKIDLKICLEFS